MRSKRHRFGWRSILTLRQMLCGRDTSVSSIASSSGILSAVLFATQEECSKSLAILSLLLDHELISWWPQSSQERRPLREHHHQSTAPADIRNDPRSIVTHTRVASPDRQTTLDPSVTRRPPDSTPASDVGYDNVLPGETGQCLTHQIKSH